MAIVISRLAGNCKTLIYMTICGILLKQPLTFHRPVGKRLKLRIFNLFPDGDTIARGEGGDDYLF
jgi:hypothetical protein